MDKFAEWLKLQEVGADIPMPKTVPQDRQPKNVIGGLSDRLDLNNPMRRKDNPTSAFPTYTDPLPRSELPAPQGGRLLTQPIAHS